MDDDVTKLLDAPTKWVGMYTALASGVCMLAMAADIFHGLKNKKFWFPCKYFSLNATFLTLLAVAMKPPMDLSDQLYKDSVYFTKVSSVTFMCMVMVNFMSSLGSMDDQATLTNTIALGILALTIVGNMWIQVIQLLPYQDFSYELFAPTIFLLILLVTLVSSTLAVPNIKRSLELKYQEMHKLALIEEHVITRSGKFTVANKVEEMKKYWVMAETSSPQFVMSRSVVSTTSSAICLLATFTVAKPSLQSYIWMPLNGMGLLWFPETHSAYKWSIKWIIAIQSIGVVVGAIAPTLRWFNNVRQKCSTMSYRSIREEFKIENYWTQTLVDWRDGSLALHIHHDKCRKYFHYAKWSNLNVCIKVQIWVVLLSKIHVILFVLLTTAFTACFTRIKKSLVFLFVLLDTYVIHRSSKGVNSSNPAGTELRDDITQNLSRYVLLLEGEQELPQTILKKICDEADKIIQKGKMQQPENLINFLDKLGYFYGLREFDSVQVPSLHSQEPANCWSLPVVTLTTIAIALANVANNNKAKQLLSCVSEAMSFAKLVDKTLDTNGELKNLRRAADVSWIEVVLYWKWQDMDLHNTSFSFKSSKAILQKLSNKAKSIVREFKREVKDTFMQNPLCWPVRVIAANSMYRICETILLSMTGENESTDEQLFQKLSVMIANIFAACFTNLPHVISTMCRQSAIEKREKSVRKAFSLLGQTEGILEHIQQREGPPFVPGFKVLYIDEWRGFFQHDHENPAASTSSNVTVTMQLSGDEN